MKLTNPGYHPGYVKLGYYGKLYYVSGFERKRAFHVTGRGPLFNLPNIKAALRRLYWLTTIWAVFLATVASTLFFIWFTIALAFSI